MRSCVNPLTTHCIYGRQDSQGHALVNHFRTDILYSIILCHGYYYNLRLELESKLCRFSWYRRGRRWNGVHRTRVARASVVVDGGGRAVSERSAAAAAVPIDDGTTATTNCRPHTFLVRVSDRFWSNHCSLRRDFYVARRVCDLHTTVTTTTLDAGADPEGGTD